MPPKILDRHYKIRPSTDHRAKFQAGRPTHLRDLAVDKKNIMRKTEVIPKTIVFGVFKRTKKGCHFFMKHHVERHLQRCLNKLQYWADTNGFRFSTSKTVCIHFCRLLKPHLDPELSLNGMPIPVVEETKFLGLIIDHKLSFIPHLHDLKEKCLKAINLLRVVAHTSWGADQQTLLHLYRFLIRSKLDYGCIVYGSARPSYLKILDPIHNHALCLCLGAFRTSPAVNLCVQATEPPLALKCKKLALQYCLKLSANTNNPAYNAVWLKK